jgi:hypothetical protein
MARPWAWQDRGHGMTEVRQVGAIFRTPSRRYLSELVGYDQIASNRYDLEARDDHFLLRWSANWDPEDTTPGGAADRSHLTPFLFDGKS